MSRVKRLKPALQSEAATRVIHAVTSQSSRRPRQKKDLTEKKNPQPLTVSFLHSMNLHMRDFSKLIVVNVGVVTPHWVCVCVRDATKAPSVLLRPAHRGSWSFVKEEKKRNVGFSTLTVMLLALCFILWLYFASDREQNVETLTSTRTQSRTGTNIAASSQPVENNEILNEDLVTSCSFLFVLFVFQL